MTPDCSGSMNTICLACWAMIKQACDCKPARRMCACPVPKPYCEADEMRRLEQEEGIKP